MYDNSCPNNFKRIALVAAMTAFCAYLLALSNACSGTGWMSGTASNTGNPTNTSTGTGTGTATNTGTGTTSPTGTGTGGGGTGSSTGKVVFAEAFTFST